jgi:hypothetical protein
MDAQTGRVTDQGEPAIALVIVGEELVDAVSDHRWELLSMAARLKRMLLGLTR